jgi:ketosteroid isomerase-like protein
MSNSTDQDQTRLRQLNDQYIESVLKSDVDWYRQHLADDFICIDSEGSTFDKGAFLQRTARGTEIADYRLENVTVRIYGETALVQATGLFTLKNGAPGMCRYTDVYVRVGADWRVVSAQITRANVRAQAA